MRLLDWIFQPLIALLVRRVVAEAEVHTAIRCAESLQQAYARADQLESEGYIQLAKELREQADAIDLSNPGQRALQYSQTILEQGDTASRNGRIKDDAAISSRLDQTKKLPQAPQKKRGPGRPRKNPKT